MSISVNNMIGKIGLAQGVEIGSKAYLAGGSPPFSGQTGGHMSYGWRHDFKLSSQWIRAVLANYGSRPCYYLDAPLRESGYRIGGRPVGWTPEDPEDLSNGERAYVTSKGLVRVSGPDLQHFWLDPLWAIIDDADDNMLVPIHTGETVPAHYVARIMAQLLTDSLAGMVNHHGRWSAGGRPAARIIDTFNQAGKRGCVTPQAALVVVDWLDKVALPFWEKAPGVREVKGSGYCNWYHECGWMLLPVYEAEQLSTNLDPALDLPNRLMFIRERIAQWMLDIDRIAGGDARWEQLRITPEMKQGVDGEPPMSLDGIIKASDLRGQWSYTLWSVTAADIARRTHPSDAADEFFDRVKTQAFKEADQPHEKVWLVDGERQWL